WALAPEGSLVVNWNLIGGLLCWRQKIDFYSPLQCRAIQIRLLVFVASRPACLAHNISGEAGAQFLLQRAADKLDQIVGYSRIKANAQLSGYPAENLAELLVRRFPQPDLGLNSPQKCRIDQLVRIHV